MKTIQVDIDSFALDIPDNATPKQINKLIQNIVSSMNSSEFGWDYLPDYNPTQYTRNRTRVFNRYLSSKQLDKQWEKSEL